MCVWLSGFEQIVVNMKLKSAAINKSFQGLVSERDDNIAFVANKKETRAGRDMINVVGVNGELQPYTNKQILQLRHHKVFVQLCMSYIT